MNQREKLIELLNETFEQQYEKRGVLTADHTADFLLENGVIVPPCKLEQTVYDVTEFFEGYDFSEIYELRDRCMCFEKCGESLLFTYDGIYIKHEDIGKTVFLTREEAEKALAERSDK